MIVKFLSFRFACVCSPERGNQPGAISFTLITFYYYELRRCEGVRTIFRAFISRRRKSASGVAPRILVVIEHARSRAALGRARLAIHSRARLLLSRWARATHTLNRNGSTVAIMIIKKHRNGSIFGEPTRQLYALLLRRSLLFPISFVTLVLSLSYFFSFSFSLSLSLRSPNLEADAC